jgi:hypothetical protein
MTKEIIKSRGFCLETASGWSMNVEVGIDVSSDILYSNAQMIATF